LAQLALAWVLRRKTVTSVLVGASRVSQVDAAVGTLSGLGFEADELEAIDGILA
jgi:L-glyceraldehyde 3-phosphate reductase